MGAYKRELLEELSTQEEQDWYKYQGVACPYCGTLRVEWAPVESLRVPGEREEVLAEPAQCQECGAMWMNLHALVGYQDFEEVPEEDQERIRNNFRLELGRERKEA
jgi:hypothetical protein